MAQIEGVWPSLEQKTSWRLQSFLKPPVRMVSPSENCDHFNQQIPASKAKSLHLPQMPYDPANQQLDSSDQVQLITTARATPYPPSSHAPPTNDSPPDVATPVTANSPITTLEEENDPSITPDNHSGSLLDSLLLPSTPPPTSN